MKEVWLSVLRDKHTNVAEFRRTSDQLARCLAAETLAKLAAGRVEIETPLGHATGTAPPDDVMVVVILRAALALLEPFMEAIPGLPVGFVGIERDELTARPCSYYQKFPRVLPGRAIVLDPMLATGGSAGLAIAALRRLGYTQESIYFTGVIAAEEGLRCLSRLIPEAHITVAAVDPALNPQKYIVPGLGDYGDRYYGT
jgi:uracil phosphoribosyltransferase